MARRPRRPNHGERVAAGDLAWSMLDRRLPRGQIRLQRARLVWSELVPAAFAAHVWPGTLRRGTLTLLADDGQWLHELTYLKSDLLARLRERAPELGIERIEARLASRAAPRPPAPRPRPPPPTRERVPLPADLSSHTVAAIESLTDPALREIALVARRALSEPRES